MRDMVTPTTAYDGADHRDNWMQTFTGRQFFVYRPWDSEIIIDDIAHHLALVNRFTGATRVPYSVAQHCVLASQLVPSGFELEALLHDAAEAYLNDMGSPLKGGMSEYQAIEAQIEQRIMSQFGLCGEMKYVMSAEVKHVDLLLVATEARDLMANPPTMWHLPVAPLSGVKIDPWPWDRAEREYLRRFEALTR